ncbi:MAG: YcxB family protein [Fretibacterium sp.]|nr:YcxB family protein [Fretibacterium sp.]
MTLHVTLDGRTFRRFALFDTLQRQRLWRRPALFACLMILFSLVCFLGGSTLLAFVLFSVGFGLPAVWFGTFLFQVNAQARRLNASHASYPVTLDEAGILGPGLEAALPWEQVHSARRAQDCVYLYVTPSRAILLPQGAIAFEPHSPSQKEELWTFLTQHMPGRCQDL